MVISPVPSKLDPAIFLAVCNAVAVEALPVKAPTKLDDVTEVNPVSVVSRFMVTVPLVPPPFRLVPAVTPAISPDNVSACQPLVVSYTKA